MPNFGSGDVDVWTKGVYRTQVCDIGKLENASGDKSPSLNYPYWEYLTWKETNTDPNDESERYVRVNFADIASISTTKVGYLTGDGMSGTDIGGGYKQIYLPDVVNEGMYRPCRYDLKIFFNIFQLKGASPVISDVSVTGKWNPITYPWPPYN